MKNKKFLGYVLFIFTVSVLQACGVVSNSLAPNTQLPTLSNNFKGVMAASLGQSQSDILINIERECRPYGGVIIDSIIQISGSSEALNKLGLISWWSYECMFARQKSNSGKGNTEAKKTLKIDPPLIIPSDKKTESDDIITNQSIDEKSYYKDIEILKKINFKYGSNFKTEEIPARIEMLESEVRYCIYQSLRLEKLRFSSIKNKTSSKLIEEWKGNCSGRNMSISLKSKIKNELDSDKQNIRNSLKKISNEFFSALEK
jgi:hypothetical protein